MATPGAQKRVGDKLYSYEIHALMFSNKVE